MDPLTIISIIIGICNAIPTIITAIEDIIAFIRAHRNPQEAQRHTQTLLSLLQDYHASKDASALQHGLATLKAGMLGSTAPAP